MCFWNLDSRDYLRDQMDFKLNTKAFGAYHSYRVEENRHAKNVDRFC